MHLPRPPFKDYFLLAAHLLFSVFNFLIKKTNKLLHIAHY